MEKEREHIRFIIQRYDNYINAANTKGNFLLAFNTFLCGGVITNYSKIVELIDCSEHYIVNTALVFLFSICLIATTLIIKAVYPFLNSGNSSKDKYHSHIFFNSVSEFETGKDFYNSFSQQNDAEADQDLAIQAHQLSQGLKAKYYFIDWAMRLVYLELFILSFLFTIILIY